jgi:thiol-disulfide isomerase/thioredoxin
MMKSLTIMFILILGTGIAFSDDSDENMMMMSDSFMTGGKINFTTLEDAMETALSGPAVLFFYAEWCPACRSALNDIDANIDQLGNVTVIIVNYDTEKELKVKYGIFYQHTFVQINSAGEKVAVWSGGGVESILNHVVAGEGN